MEGLVLKAIERFSLLGDNRNITVALSGGADSMALLYLLLNLKDRLNISVTAAHLNHMIRGDEAERDQCFVENQCKKLGVKLFCEKADIPKIAEENKISTELAARQVRYEFLNRIANGLIATAHTASDNLETVLLNMTRGTALNGLCGIPPKRDNIIRPLILCTRAQVEEYCKANKIPFVTDSTNLTDNYTRNKIRHNVIPVLKEINPSLEDAVLRMSGSVKEDSEYLENKAFQYIINNTTANSRLVLKEFEFLDISLKKRILRKFIETKNSNISLEAVHINNALEIALNGGRTSLPQNCFAVSINGEFAVINEKSDNNSVKFNVTFEECEAEFSEKTQKINNLLLNNAIDCDKMVGRLEIRTRKKGDSIRLLNRGCTKSLNKIFNENKIPCELRDKIPVIADSQGVVWVYSVGIAQRCAITHKTKRYVKISVKGEN